MPSRAQTKPVTTPVVVNLAEIAKVLPPLAVARASMLTEEECEELDNLLVQLLEASISHFDLT